MRRLSRLITDHPNTTFILRGDETRRKREDEAAHHNANLYLQPNARNVPGMSMRMGHTQLLIQQAPGKYEYYVLNQ